VAVLSVSNLETAFALEQGLARAVRDVSLTVEAGETLGLVGESGCGKSVLALSIMRLLPPNARIVAGSVEVAGTDVLKLSHRGMREIRGKRVGMVFQDSMTSLNPVLTVGRQITESIEAHTPIDRRGARQRALSLLEEVGVPEPERRLRQYPHQLSGGLRQRVAVAVALAPSPEVLIADEPTTALDVTIQAQLLDLLKREQQSRNMAVILITHDLGVVAGMADRVAVMYAGRIVEQAATERLFSSPSHPYTRGLLAAVPRIDGPLDERLSSIPGSPPAIADIPQGCPFRPRCGYVVDRCALDDPPLRARQPGHSTACWADISEVVS
jgi:oligopeptide/dipeptide ABC transporter ATP-binding protein